MIPINNCLVFFPKINKKNIINKLHNGIIVPSIIDNSDNYYKYTKYTSIL